MSEPRFSSGPGPLYRRPPWKISLSRVTFLLGVGLVPRSKLESESGPKALIHWAGLWIGGVRL